MALNFYKFEFLLPKDALCKVWLKLALWFWRKRFLNFVNIFSLFQNYLPLEKGRDINFDKLKSPWPRDTFCQVWLKFAQWFWRRTILNFVNVFLLFRYHLPLEKGGTLHLKLTWIPFSYVWLVPSLVEIGPVVLEKKSLQQMTMTTTTDNRHILIRKAHCPSTIKCQHKR